MTTPKQHSPLTQAELDSLVAEALALNEELVIDPAVIAELQRSGELATIAHEAAGLAERLMHTMSIKAQGTHDHMTRFECGIFRVVPQIHHTLRPQLPEMALFFGVLVVTALGHEFVSRNEHLDSDISWHEMVDAEWRPCLEAVMRMSRLDQVRAVVTILRDVFDIPSSLPYSPPSSEIS